ncbi:MAG: hybrid sensor histidine kinase/response regulator [Duodenibacillus sp.]|nr:hybrid sensor histidine kinase/response regulator [Duodenibacillus sp.]
MRKLWKTVKEYFGFHPVKLSGPVLAEQFALSLRLQPTSAASQLIGAAAIAIYFWHGLSQELLVGWVISVAVTIYLWISFGRRFRADQSRASHMRDWIRRWMFNTSLTGIVWGFAGSALMVTAHPVDQVVLISVIVAIVFASWPSFSCWLPGLTVLTLLALTPMLVAISIAYKLSSILIAVILIVITCFVLYSGRRLNELVILAVTQQVRNEQLVTKLKAERDAAERERRIMERDSARRSRFFAGANHDLRQPLQAMGIYLQILKSQQTGQNKEVIGQLESASRSISDLVEQILEVSRIETGNIETKIERLRVSELFEQLSAEFVPVAAEKRLIFSTHPVNASMETDPQLVARILRNLITNAIRYTTRQGGRITLGARLVGGNLIIGVYDEGPGIPSDELESIFEPFYRGSTSKGGAKGYGLGLSIVWVLAKKLGIELSVSSRLGRGSVFRLKLPALPDSQVRTAPAKGSAPTGLDLRGVVGLLEDSDIVREAVAAILRGWGATVIESAEPNEAFIREMANANSKGRLTTFISDFNLGPGKMNGLEAIFRVREISEKKVPSVLLTAIRREVILNAYRNLVIASSVTGQPMPVILQKPASAETLATALRKAIAEG